MYKGKTVFVLCSASVMVMLMMFFSSWAHKSFFKMPRQTNTPASDSIQANLQHIFDSVATYIYDRDDAISRLNKAGNDSIKNRQDIINARDAYAVLKASINLKGLCASLSAQKEGSVFDTLKIKFDSLAAIDKQLTLLLLNKDTLEHRLEVTRLEVNTKQKQFDSTVTFINKKTSSLNGKYVFRFKSIECTVFFANRQMHTVSILPPPAKGASTISDVLKHSIQSLKDTPLMITNGGMYRPDFKPQGLLVYKHQKLHEADTAHTPANGNFYLEPNGVFYIDTAGGFGLLPTREYLSTFKEGKLPLFATQSGPLLVNNNLFNPYLKPASVNLNIRSGAGVISADKVVFIISRQPINFYDFAVIFRDFFHCKYALYLDGFVSKMYTNDKYPLGISPVVDDGVFGPMIVVTPKK